MKQFRLFAIVIATTFLLSSNSPAQNLNYYGIRAPNWANNYYGEIQRLVSSQPNMTGYHSCSHCGQINHITGPVPPNPLLLGNVVARQAFKFGAVGRFVTLRDINPDNRSFVRITLIDEGGTGRIWCQSSVWLERFNSEEDAFAWVASQYNWPGYTVVARQQPSYSDLQ